MVIVVKPYVLRFVSLESGKGKTSIATSVIAKLKLRGYLIAAIKHAVHGIDIDEKDTSRYINAGADIVIASSNNLGAIYYSKWMDSLDHILRFVNAPIVIVEGFRRCNIGDVIAVVDSHNEFNTLSRDVVGNIIAVIHTDNVSSEVSGLGVNVFNRDDVDGIVSFVESRALKFLENQLPQNNCGLCGFETCTMFVKFYAMGKVYSCPVSSDIRLVIDSKDIPLNPFVKNILRSTINGFIDSLKGIPPQRRKILIEIEL